jgi:hypothetical protein
LEAAPPNTFQGFPGNIDFGAFYTPFILDPQSTEEMLIGTCRVWRGAITPDENPGVFNELSVNFDTLDATLCNGGEVNQVAGLAAGGPTDTNGFSNVVYATTFGFGPLANLGTGGEVWATTNASTTGPSNVTGSINPNNYAIASVAIDTSVADGQTAYVGIMGFSTPAHPTSHVWKTTNAGASWTDWTGALPDAPVSSLLVDAATGLIYAGTDVGLFVSSTSSASWPEVGPAAGSGAGFLPSAPVTAIRIFDNGVTKKLRVSTYGRGIWEFNLPLTPNFTLSANPSSLSIAQGTNGTSTITVNPTDGFTGSVSLVASGLPSGVTASFNPTSTTTTSTLTLTVSNSATPTTATVTITGTSGGLTHTTTVALTVNPDFTWTISSTSHTVLSGQQTPAYTFTATPSGGTFALDVNLACPSGLPDATVACVFSIGSNAVTKIAAGSGTTNVTLAITTTGPNSGTGTAIPRHADKRSPWLPLAFPLAGIVMAGFAGRKMSKYSALAGLCVSLALLGLLVACGGGGSTPPPPIGVTVSQGTPSSVFPNDAADSWPTQTATFTATVTNTTNTAVTWAVTGGSANGTIASSGTNPPTATYTAPTVAAGLPASVTITATSQADSTKSGSAQETLKAATIPGTYSSIMVTATEGVTAHSQTVSLTVQ